MRLVLPMKALAVYLRRVRVVIPVFWEVARVDLLAAIQLCPYFQNIAGIGGLRALIARINGNATTNLKRIKKAVLSL